MQHLGGDELKKLLVLAYFHILDYRVLNDVFPLFIQVVVKNKREGKQRAAQAILQVNRSSFNSLQPYGDRDHGQHWLS